MYFGFISWSWQETLLLLLGVGASATLLLAGVILLPLQTTRILGRKFVAAGIVQGLVVIGSEELRFPLALSYLVVLCAWAAIYGYIRKTRNANPQPLALLETIIILVTLVNLTFFYLISFLQDVLGSYIPQNVGYTGTYIVRIAVNIAALYYSYLLCSKATKAPLSSPET